MAKVIGIDLGTTNSVVAVVEGGDPAVIANQEGSRLTPSVVAFTKEGETLVGQVAKRQAITNPDNTVFSIKRFMGRRYDEVLRRSSWCPTRCSRPTNGDARVEIRGKEYSPPEISALVLRKLKEAAEAYLGEKVTQAVITVPAYFNDSQRQATKDAGEPSPGWRCCGSSTSPPRPRWPTGSTRRRTRRSPSTTWAAAPSTSRSWRSARACSRCKATNGDTHLGGDDFDQRVMDWIADEFKRENGIDLRKDRMALQRLKEAAEKAKCELSTTVQTEINLPVHHRGRQRAQAPGADAHPGQARVAGGRSDRAQPEPCRRGDAPGAGSTADDIDEVDPGRRPDAHAQGAGRGQEALRQGAEQDRQPGRGRGASARRCRRRCSPARSRTSCCST